MIETRKRSGDPRRKGGTVSGETEGVGDDSQDFYNGLLDDLDGGKVVIADGKISNEEAGWSYRLNQLSHGQVRSGSV